MNSALSNKGRGTPARPKTASGKSIGAKLRKIRKENRRIATLESERLGVKPWYSGMPEMPRRVRRRRGRKNNPDPGLLVDDEYALAVAFPESAVEGRIPDDVLRPSCAQTLRQRYVWTMSAGGRGVLTISPQLKSHTNEGAVNDATGAITWGGLTDHVDYTSMAANFARYRPVALGVRVVNSASTYLNLSGEIGSTQITGLDSTAYPTAAASFTTLVSYNGENVAPASCIPEEGGFRAVWIPQANYVNSYISIDTNSTAFGCGSAGSLILTAIGLPASTTLVVETYLKVETVPFADTEYLYTPKVAIANEGAIEKALHSCARWLASSGKTVAGATAAMKSLSVMSALERAGGFLGRIVGIGGWSDLTMDERVLADLVRTGRLQQKLQKLSDLQILPAPLALTDRAGTVELVEMKTPEISQAVPRLPPMFTAGQWFRP